MQTDSLLKNHRLFFYGCGYYIYISSWGYFARLGFYLHVHNPSLFDKKAAIDLHLSRIQVNLKMEVIMLWKKTRAGVAANLIICVVFSCLVGGVSQVAGETSSAEPEILEGTEVELIKVTKPEFITVIEPEFLEVTEPEFIEVIEPDFLVSFVDSDGLTKRGGQQKSVEQIMCGTSNGLPTPRKCLFEGR